MSLTKVTFSMIDSAPVNVKDFGATGDGVTDDTAAIQAAIDSTVVPGIAPPYTGMLGNGSIIYLPLGTYRISQTITIPNATTIKGDGRNATRIRPLPGFTGAMLTDKGHAGKIFIEDLRIDAAFPTGVSLTPIAGYENVTACIELGLNLIQHGQAKLENLIMYGGASANCLNVSTNIATYVDLECGSSPITFNSGGVGAVFERCFSIGASTNDFVVSNGGTISNCEIEGPQSGCIPIYVNRSASISNLILSLNNSTPTTIDALIEMDALSTNISLNGFNYFAGAGFLTNMIKDNRTAKPPYWGSPQAGYSVNGSVVSTEFHYDISSARRQSFRFWLINDGGTLKHRITNLVATDGSNFDGKISGATQTYTATPTGTDSSTDFATGAKILSSNTSVLAFNTNSQGLLTRTMSGTVTMHSNTSGTALSITPAPVSLDINGVTRRWYMLAFTNAASGAAFDLTSLSAGQQIVFNFEGFIE